MESFAKCFVCGNGNTMRCGRCGSIAYCSSECQRKDWGRHKPSCVVANKELETVNKFMSHLVVKAVLGGFCHHLSLTDDQVLNVKIKDNGKGEYLLTVNVEKKDKNLTHTQPGLCNVKAGWESSSRSYVYGLVREDCKESYDAINGFLELPKDVAKYQATVNILKTTASITCW